MKSNEDEDEAAYRLRDDCRSDHVLVCFLKQSVSRF
jgi:hypothetical protein